MNKQDFVSFARQENDTCRKQQNRSDCTAVLVRDFDEYMPYVENSPSSNKRARMLY